MKGPLRVALLLCTALPVQRWLLVPGAIIMIAGYAIDAEARPIALVGLIIAFLPTLFAGGVLSRYLAAPRVMQLIPHMRAQILLGMALVTGLFATAFAAVMMSLGADFDLVLVWLRVATAVSVFMIAQVVLLSGTAGFLLWLLVVNFLVLTLGAAGKRGLTLWILQSPGLLCTVTALTWCAFAIWFVRARRFSTPKFPGIIEWGAPRVRATSGNAVRAFLFGNPSLSAQFSGGLFIAALLILSWGMLAWFGGHAHSFGEAFDKATWIALGIGAYAGVGGWMVARRSKFLWLRCGLERHELFRTCERVAWTNFLANACGLLLLVPLVWLWRMSHGQEYMLLMAAQLCTGACLLYLGLMCVRGWRVIDVLIGSALGTAWLTAIASSAYLLNHPRSLLALCATLLASAFALRLAGLHRWRRIDWLVCRPPLPVARNEAHPA